MIPLLYLSLASPSPPHIGMVKLGFPPLGRLPWPSGLINEDRPITLIENSSLQNMLFAIRLFENLTHSIVAVDMILVPTLGLTTVGNYVHCR